MTDLMIACEIFVSEAGVWQETEISDHSAVWTILSIEETKQYE